MEKIEIFFDGKMFWVRHGENVSALGQDEVLGAVITIMGKAQMWSRNYLLCSYNQDKEREEFYRKFPLEVKNENVQN